MIFLLTGYSGSNSILSLIGLIILCILIIVASFYTTKFVGSKQMGRQKNGNFRILEMLKLSQNKCLQLVQIGKRYVVLAVCKDSVQVILELSEDEFQKLPKTNETVSFKAVLANISSKKRKDTVSLDHATEDLEEEQDNRNTK